MVTTLSATDQFGHYRGTEIITKCVFALEGDIRGAVKVTDGELILGLTPPTSVQSLVIVLCLGLVELRLLRPSILRHKAT